jgi:hypothetical protein
MKGMRFERIQFSTDLHETEAARATSRFLMSPESSAAAPLAGRVSSRGTFVNLAEFMRDNARMARVIRIARWLEQPKDVRFQACFFGK